FGLCAGEGSLVPAGMVTGPKLVTVEHGSSLAVSCSYRPRYKLNSKYWCLKNSLLFCLTYIIQTDGSEVTVTRDRVSIRDNHTANSFTVTLSSVTLGDAGRYSFRAWDLGKPPPASPGQNLLFPCMCLPALSPQRASWGQAGQLADMQVPHSSRTSLLLHRSQLSVIHLLLLLSIKVPVALAVVCGAAWLRSRCRSRDQEKPQLLELCSSTRAGGCPPVPSTSEPQGRPPAPPGPSLQGPGHP
uniref:Immunoglobulin V-set domain-containing protein n=1 Tax=Cyanoderma ruficeps TaxID=181631 RepID=A0A8C3QGL3_9PASS